MISQLYYNIKIFAQVGSIIELNWLKDSYYSLILSHTVGGHSNVGREPETVKDS